MHTVLGRASWLVMALTSMLATGCGDGSASSSIFPPKFVVSKVQTDHGIFSAQWYITIANEGGPGSQLVQYWAGSAEDKSSRTIIYSERLYLGLGEQKTISDKWDHAAIGTIGTAIVM